jgi:hypothetical protein
VVLAHPSDEGLGCYYLASTQCGALMRAGESFESNNQAL